MRENDVCRDVKYRERERERERERDCKERGREIVRRQRERL